MARAGEGGRSEVDPGDVLRLVSRILISARELERRFDACLAGERINLSRADVLACVARHGDAGCAQTELAADLRLSESNICTLVERMRADGWLLRMRSGLDRRRSVIVLTPRARQSLEHFEQLRENRAAEWLRGLSGPELQQLNALLDRLLAALGDNRTDVRPAGVAAATTSRKSYRRAS